MPTAAIKCPLVHEWMASNYVQFLDYAQRAFRHDLGTHEDREDAIADLIVKALSTNAFENRLKAGGDLSYRSLLRFCEQRHFHNMDHSARDWCGRAGGLRTRKELKEGVVEFGAEIPDFGGEGKLVDHSAAEDGFVKTFELEVMDPSPSALDMCIVDETYEMIMEGMFREWNDAPLETRLRVLELLRSGGNQGDIQRMLEVGPTRAKTFKKEIREVVTHSLRPRATRRRSKTAARIREIQGQMEAAGNTDTDGITDVVFETAKAVETAAIEKMSKKRLAKREDRKLVGIDVPQHDRLGCIQDAIAALHGKQVPDGALPKAHRHVLYMRQAMKVLGLLNDEGAPTELCSEIHKNSGNKDFRSLIREAFEATAVCRAWVRWSGVNDVANLDPASSVNFLNVCTTLSKSTCQRRGQTLRHWVQFLTVNP